MENILLSGRLHEAMIVLYSISILLYFIDFVQKNQKVNRAAFWILSIVWVLQTLFLIAYMIETKRFPVLTIFEGLYFYAWVLISLSMAINRLLQVDFTVFFTNILGFIIMVIHTFAQDPIGSKAIAGQLMSELLFIHVTMAILSYGAFSLSFVFSLLYLLQYRLLKEKKWGQRLWRLGDLHQLETISFRLIAIGVPMLLLSLILGLQWAWVKLPNVIWYDPKILGSFLLLVIYSTVLYLRARSHVFGRTLARINVGAFLIILINFLLVSRVSTFHFWY
ncbi:cytochrome C assembly protein [Bacillus coahuilensis m2-6]|uniref:Cytochrome C assembly protein n=1 Tax=Bacillus coahuilensis p1.1.43 TaxID=1150625 RepID=A0A147K731_9BACI|nr:cytochrome c biogenesis protein CcsA [Bacillus coahuilensis]KUP05893.1 cytochrome C assembly protein [Bacillus coahuilensis p1.1.43]KUP06989.1 cytochrome C assembly protein [Bacillus coahuilensis m2-6]